MIASLDLDGLLAPLFLSPASVDPAILAVRIEAAISTIEAWLGRGPDSPAELRRNRTADMIALHARTAVTPPRLPMTLARVVFRCGQGDISHENFDLIGEEIEVALGGNGEYVGHDYGGTTGILQIYLLGPDLSAMMDAILPAVERFAGQGSYYESRRLDDPSSASPVWVDL